jgi:ABC-2 type transport system ATP-binding protein
MSYAIEITDIRKQYNGAIAPALDGFSFMVKDNTVAGLLGPNGAGKTTCISILCGLVAADSGQILVGGMDCRKQIMQIRSIIGMVPQQIALFGNLTANENYTYIGRLYGLSGGQIRERAAYLMERLGLEKHADKQVKLYSGGMKRRANIIASLLHRPKLLILDEPTAGVDVQSRAMILSFLKELKAEGNTILYTSHLMDEAEQICDEVVIIDEGKYVASGTPEGLVRKTPECGTLEDVFLHYTGRTVRDN